MPLNPQKNLYVFVTHYMMNIYAQNLEVHVKCASTQLKMPCRINKEVTKLKKTDAVQLLH